MSDKNVNAVATGVATSVAPTAEKLEDAANKIEEILSPKITELLSTEQRAAIVSKWNTLDEDIRERTKSKFPGVENEVELFTLRYLVKTANAANASMLRPGYISQLMLVCRALVSVVAESKKEAERTVRKIADEVEGKEASTIVKAVKVKLDMDSKNPAILAMCGLMGIDPSSIK